MGKSMQTTTLSAQIAPQAQGSSWTPDPTASAVAGRCSSALAWYGQKAVLHRAITPAETDVLNRRLGLVRKTLLPASGETELKRIGRALSVALMGYARPDTDKLVRDYTRLLSNLPAWAIEQACDDIRRGAVPSMNPAYPPSAPEIHKLADQKLIEARAERDNLTVLLTAPVEEANLRCLRESIDEFGLDREFHAALKPKQPGHPGVNYDQVFRVRTR
jgi:hypothetical protein